MLTWQTICDQEDRRVFESSRRHEYDLADNVRLCEAVS